MVGLSLRLMIQMVNIHVRLLPFTVMLPSPGTKRTRATEFYDGLCLYIQLVPM